MDLCCEADTKVTHMFLEMAALQHGMGSRVFGGELQSHLEYQIRFLSPPLSPRPTSAWLTHSHQTRIQDECVAHD